MRRGEGTRSPLGESVFLNTLPTPKVICQTNRLRLTPAQHTSTYDAMSAGSTIEGQSRCRRPQDCRSLENQSPSQRNVGAH